MVAKKETKKAPVQNPIPVQEPKAEKRTRKSFKREYTSTTVRKAFTDFCEAYELNELSISEMVNPDSEGLILTMQDGYQILNKTKKGYENFTPVCNAKEIVIGLQIATKMIDNLR